MPEKKLSILVADDNRVNQLFIKTVLEKEGHKVTMADNGQETVNLFKGDSFDLVFMDIQMPVMDGYDAAMAIRAYEREHSLSTIPIVALTAYIDASENSRAGDADFDRFLSKPLSSHQIITVLYEMTTHEDPKPEPVPEPENSRKNLPALEKQLLKEFSGNEDTLRSMLRMALTDIPLRMNSLDQAFSKGDNKKAIKDAHSLANIAGVLYRLEEHSLALTIEKLIAQGDREKVSPLLLSLKGRLDTMMETFHALLQGPLAE